MDLKKVKRLAELESERTRIAKYLDTYSSKYEKKSHEKLMFSHYLEYTPVEIDPNGKFSYARGYFADAGIASDDVDDGPEFKEMMSRIERFIKDQLEVRLKEIEKEEEEL